MLYNSKAGFCHEHTSVENTDLICISQVFLQADTVWSDVGFFDLKNRASIVALIKQLAAANPCAARKSSFSFFTTQSFPGSSGS